MSKDARPTSRLAAAASGKPAQTQPSRFQAAISGARVREPFEIPRLGLGVVVTLCPYSEQERIEGEVFARMAALGLSPSVATENVYEAARALRTMAITFLDPDTDAPIGSLADWSAIDEDTIGECWRFQGQVRAKYDPIQRPVSQEEIDAVAAAVKKKDASLLRFFGTRMLASYLLATGEPPSISQTPTFGPSGSSPES